MDRQAVVNTSGDESVSHPHTAAWRSRWSSWGFWRDEYGGYHLNLGPLSAKVYRQTLRPQGRGLTIFWRTP